MRSHKQQSVWYTGNDTLNTNEVLFAGLREHHVEFLWVTDGPAWHKMQQPLLLSMKEIDWVLNYRMMDLIRRILK